MHRDTKNLGILFGTLVFLAIFVAGMAGFLHHGYDAIAIFLAIACTIASLFSGGIFLLNLLYLDKQRS